MAKGERIVGLDLGTTKVAAVIAELDENLQPRIVGVGLTPSRGMRRGTVINLEQTVESIKRAVGEAERMAGCKVDSCYVGIAGSHISSMNCRGVVAVEKAGGEITQRDKARVIEQAKTIGLPLDREIIHVIPIEFIVDDQPGICDPVGMFGKRLEVEVHIVTGAVTSAQNIYRSIERAGLRIKDLVLQPLASAYAVLEADEKELGVLLVDIGGGTTDMAIFKEGSIRHTQVLGLGGEHITSDIAIGLRTPTKEAEETKKRYGCALANLVDEDQTFTVKGVGGRSEKQVSRRILASIIEPRVEEILTLAHREMKKTEFAELLAAGVVITGGSAHLEGIEAIAEQIFDLPVKVGKPWGTSGLTDIIADPIFATGVGLVRYGIEKQNLTLLPSGTEDRLFGNILSRMRDWLKEFF
ncbi:MAG: cell division protein FtsA [Candidatus Stahlbacteria bacterium]|nr:MAG: cell division protein FtsA [Candidatus Stahlbacteria bacterium]